MLLARVAAELRTNTDLSRYLLPVRFMEESLEIFDVADFWLECLFYLARESAVGDPELTRELRETHSALAARGRGEELIEARARAAVLNAADRLGKQLVLMVENLQDLCGDVDEDFGWKLREALQSQPEIMLLATATSRFKGLDDATQPFFELFRTLGLDPLAIEECQRLWHVVSGDAVGEREVRPLQILTGGSPRLLVYVADFARHGSLRQLMEQLVTLIDEHTEYFRTHLEGFAKTERRVYLATIDLWQPSTTGEITARARLDVRIVSNMLGRLVHRGAVMYEGTGRKRRYSAVERLYGIYYKLRRERDEAAIVRNLIHFMAVFYGSLTGIDDVGIDWQAMRLRTNALLHLGDRDAVLEAFRAAYDAFRIGKKTMLREMLDLVLGMIAFGVSERDLAEVLSSDRERADALAPLVVALRKRAGEPVRAPVEVIEVADDIIREIEAKMSAARV